MAKVAFVYSGQGDQFPGMGKELYENNRAAREAFDSLEKLRKGTLKQCFEGSKEELTDTENCQPCLYAFEAAATAALKDKAVKAEGFAGFSLGELSAAAQAGVFDIEEGFKLVMERGKLMKAAALKADTSMIAVLKLDEEKLRKLAEKYAQVYPVNFNCPGQISVAGIKHEMDEFKEAVKEAGGRCLPLKVQAAFHSPFMKDAACDFRNELEKYELKLPETALYSDFTAELYGDDVIEHLSKQIESPVLWEKLIRRMISDGFDTFIEIGPGKTLTNMIKKINSEINVMNFIDYLENI